MSKREHQHQEFGCEKIAIHYSEKCDKLEAKAERIQELEASLRKYGDHLGTCYKNLKIGDCNCGFEKALKG